MVKKNRKLSSERKQQLLVFFEMLLLSMAANSLAPLVVTYQEQFGLSMSQAALFPALLTVGGVLANIIGSVLISKIGVRRYNYLFLISLLFASTLFQQANSIYLLYSAIFCLGFNTATGLAVTSTVLSHLKKKFQNFGVYHAFFGMGGIISPAIISLFIHKNISYRFIYSGFFILTAITLFFLLKVKFLPEYKYENVSFRKSISILKLPVVYLSLLVLVLYAGSEMGMVLWSSNLFIKAFQFSKGSSALFISGFWAVFTITRFFNQQIEQRMGYRKTMILFPIIVLISLSLLLLKGWPILFPVVALGMAPIFPSTQKYALQHISKSQIGMFNSLLFGFLSLGNVFISGMMGVLGETNIFAAFTIPVLAMLLMIFVSGLLIRKGN